MGLRGGDGLLGGACFTASAATLVLMNCLFVVLTHRNISYPISTKSRGSLHDDALLWISFLSVTLKTQLLILIMKDMPLG